jgi:hypothetical protein
MAAKKRTSGKHAEKFIADQIERTGKTAFEIVEAALKCRMKHDAFLKLRRN